MHLYEERPWGGFFILEKGEGYQVKLLIVKPGHRLSLQSHDFRKENWTVLQGIASVTLDDMELVLKPADTLFINKGMIHRLANEGAADLLVLEAQHGRRLEEGDITRWEDDYGRQSRSGSPEEDKDVDTD